MEAVPTPPFRLRQSTATDASWMVELRAEVMFADLDRLDRFHPVRVRERFLNAFVPEQTYVIEVGDGIAGLIAVRPEADAQWIEHFYLRTDLQGRGLGSAVLADVMARHGDERPFRLNVLLGSPARRLYERHGFRFDSQDDDVDVYLTTAPAIFSHGF